MSFNEHRFSDKYQRNTHDNAGIEGGFADMRARQEVEYFLSRFEGETAFQKRLSKAFAEYMSRNAKSDTSQAETETEGSLL